MEGGGHEVIVPSILFYLFIYLFCWLEFAEKG